MSEAPHRPAGQEAGSVFVESDAVRLGMVHRLMGAVGVRGAAEPLAVPEHAVPTIEALEDISAEGMARPLLTVEDEQAQHLIASYAAGPRLQRSLYLQDREALHNDDMVATVEGSAETPILLPAANFVFAPGLDGWRGRIRGANAASSAPLIRQYAGKGDQAPPVGVVFAYTQPNGVTLFKGVGDGAHRIAAAKANGDVAVPAYQVQAYRLSRDLLPLSETR